MNSIKFLHILWFDDVKFYSNLVTMFNSELMYFDPSEHLFITPFEQVYAILKQYKNVQLVNGKHMLSKYGPHAEWIFLHPLSLKRRQVIFIKSNIAKKIIWRTWGHDIRPIKLTKSNPILNLMNILIDHLYKRKVKQFKAIGVANDIDKVNVKNRFGKEIETLILSYGYRKNIYEQLVKIKLSTQKTTNTLKIMVGHNGNIADRHIQVLEKLKKFKNEDILITLPLSYGDSLYISKIKNYALKTFGEKKVEFIEEFIPFEDFAKYISTIDIAVIDNYFSNGLGNLSLLIFFETKIFLNRYGNIGQSFKENGIVSNYTDEICKMNFSDFCTPQFDPKEEIYIRYSSVAPKDQVCNKWREILNTLNSN